METISKNIVLCKAKRKAALEHIRFSVLHKGFLRQNSSIPEVR